MGIQFSPGHGVEIDLTLSLTDSHIFLAKFASQNTFAILVYHYVYFV